MKRSRSRRLFRGFLIAAVCGASGLSLALWATDSLVARAGSGRCFTDTAQVPTNEVALVLGTAPFMADGHPNAHYVNRIEAAAALYNAGKVKYLLVSGDNGRVLYDEPTAMKKDLIARGVPENRIVCDYAGFRTLDSIIRAQKVFGLSRCTIISQRFHNERALYLADSINLHAVAFDAADPPWGIEPRLWWRERFSRLTAVLDVNVWKRQPKFLGPTVPVGRRQ